MAQPIKFTEHNLLLGSKQDEYNTLPALLTNNGTVYTQWKFTEEELQHIAEKGFITLAQLTFNNPFQPMNIFMEMPEEAIADKKFLDIIVIEKPTMEINTVRLTANSMKGMHDFMIKIGMLGAKFVDSPTHPHYVISQINMIQKAIAFGAVPVETKAIEYCFTEWWNKGK